MATRNIQLPARQFFWLILLLVAVFPSLSAQIRSAEHTRSHSNDACIVPLSDARVAELRGLTVDTVLLLHRNRALSNAEICELSDDNLEQAIDKARHPKPDHPGEAAAFRLLQTRDENGVIPTDGLERARQHVNAMRALAPPAAAGIDNNSWEAIGPGNIGGRLRSVLIHPTTPANMWVGSVGGGIWSTTNSGTSWSPVSDFLANLAIGSMAMDPTNPSVMYAGTGEGFTNFDSIRGAGVFKSTDGGASWTQLASTTSSDWFYANRLAISPNGATVLAATRTGIFRSTDGGTSWSLVRTGQTLDLDFHPTDNNRAVASDRVGNAYVSTDGGLNWTTVSIGGGRVEVAYAPSSPSTIYASVDISGGEIWRSTNDGASYTLVNTGNNFLGAQGWYDNVVWVDPTDANTVIVGGIDLWRTRNAGAALTKISSWQLAPSSAHADHHAIVAHPGFDGTSNKTVFFGNDGGIYRTDDVYAVTTTTGWQELNNNLAVTQFYGAAGNATSGVIVGGTQDNGSLRFTGNTEAWNVYFGGDGGYSAADPSDPNFFYGEYVNLLLHRSTDGGVTANDIWAGISDAGTSNANFIAPFILDPNNPNTLLGGGSDLWRSTNVKAATPTWSSIKPSIGDPISAIAVASGDSNTIWVGHNNGQLYKSVNGGGAWTQVDTGTPNLPDRYLHRITIDAGNHNVVYATFGSFNADNVWRTADGGSTWTDITGSGGTGLPDVAVRSLTIHPSTAAWLYVGTEVGVFASEDTGATWGLPQDGPANVSVDELLWVGGQLVAATHGRGLFRTTPAVGNLPEITTPTPGSTLSGASVLFQWQANGVPVTEWWLQAGSTVGATDYFDSGSLGTALSDTATGLPTDGSTVHVRLRYREAGVWKTRDYQYTAFGSSDPAITSPTPGSVLSGASVPFQWSANGATVTEWWLYAGSSVGGFEYYNSGSLGTSLSSTATGLPINGSTVHVRLWYFVGGAWQTTDYQYTAASAGGGTPAITSPASGSVLSGASVAFQWNANGAAVTQWWLYAGSTVGGTQYYDSGSLGTSLSTTVTGLPTDGTTVHVRLFHRIGGVWQSSDTQYTAASAGGGTPAITSPASGSVLSGASVAFQWNANGATVTEWWLYAGSTVGGTQYYDSGSLGTSLSTTVTGLPTDGSTVHVRLFYRIGGAWQTSDTQYTAASAGGGTPAITSPTNGSVLSGASVAFQWNANGATVTQWWLYAGSTVGGTQYYDSGSLGTSLSTTVTGLPTNGSTVHVRLFYRIGGVWQSSDTQYTAASAGGGTPAITSPTNGSVLSGASVAFQWNANGATVTEWWLYAGSSVGGTQYYDSGSLGTSLSTTVTGLPTDGSTVHVRLYYRIGGAWQTSDTQYTAASGGGGTPGITSPANGSVLSGASVAFQWSANGATVTQWWLYAGSSVGGNQYYDSGSLGTSLSTTVTGLPTDSSTVHVRLYYRIGGAWQTSDTQYTAVNGTAQGFDSQFNGDASGWQAHAGAWSIASNQWYTTLGVANFWSSVSFSLADYGELDYQARLWRSGCEGCANSVMIRGTPNPLAADSDWDTGYQFSYSRDGFYTVWRLDGGGTATPLQDWTASASIVQGAAWNTVRVVASGSTLSYYINGTLVWTGVDTTYTTGRAGIAMFRDASAGNQIWADWATLTVTGAVASNGSNNTVSPTQQAMNDAACVGGSSAQAPRDCVVEDE